MIRLNDASVLALTKLRTRKVRTIITVIIAALLFGILIALLIATQGAFRSINSFSKEGLNDRYLIAAFNGSGFEEGLFKRTSLIERAVQIHNETISEKKKTAKQLGIVYDPTTEQLPYVSFDGEKNNHLSFSHPAAKKALAEYYATKPVIGLQQLKSTAATYNPKAFYKGLSLQPMDGTLSWMGRGMESFPDPAKEQSQSGKAEDKLFGFGLALLPLELTSTFMFQGEFWKPSSGNIPILISYSNAEKLLEIPALDKNANPDEQLQRISDVRSKAANLIVSACYRNSVSQERINQAVSLPNEIAKNKGSEGYKEPTLQYSLPANDSCSGALVKADNRTKSQKDIEEKQNQFKQQFGVNTVADQQKILFQVVGIFPDPPSEEASNTVDDLVTSLVGSSSIMAQTTIPEQLYRQMPVDQQHTDILGPADPGLFAPGSDQIHLVEFNKADDARRFIREKSCTNNSFGACLPKENLFSMSVMGSNSIALDDLKQKVTKALQITFLSVAVVAMIIMSGTIGRMITDGRRETAVFRAIGFKRFDIVSVYAVYTFLLSSIIASIALLIGFLAAYLADRYYSQSLTVKTKLAFGATDPSREFHFFTLDSPLVWVVVLAVIAIGFVSMLFPLIRNVKRNPINDMRDES